MRSSCNRTCQRTGGGALSRRPESTTSDQSSNNMDNSNQQATAPTKSLLVTLAVKSPQVEKIVFSAEFGHICLTDENSKADESGTRLTTLGQVFEGSGAQ